MDTGRTGNSEPSVSTEELLAAVGIVVTDEGKARARAKLEAARARHTPEMRAALRAQIGLPQPTRLRDYARTA
jgi:hypothetical protein